MATVLMWCLFASPPPGTDHGTPRAAQARLAPVHGHSPLLQAEGANATTDQNPDPSVAHDPPLTLQSQAGSRSGAAGRGPCKHMW